MTTVQHSLYCEEVMSDIEYSDDDTTPELERPSNCHMQMVDLYERIDTLDDENAKLRERVQELEASEARLKSNIGEMKVLRKAMNEIS